MSRGRILIAEDEYLVALQLEHYLISAGFTVVGIASSAEEAVELTAAHHPDVVLMDIRLRDSDGVEAAMQIRALHGIGCIFVTAHGDPGSRDRASSTRPLGWLDKPFTKERVTEMVTEAIERLRAS